MANPFQAAYQGGQNAFAISQRDKQERKDYRDQQAITNILDRYNNPDDPLSYNQTVNQILGSIRNPQQRQNAMAALQQQEQTRLGNQQIENLKQYYKSIGQDPNLAYAPESVQKQVTGPEPKDPIAIDVQKKINADATKQIQNAGSYGQMIAQLNDMKELSKKFSGVTGRASGELYGTSAADAANKFEASSNLILEPVFKLYNPTGPLPQQKVQMLRNLLKPNWRDTQSVIDAKINAIQELIEGKVKQANKIKSLMVKHKGRIPPEEYYDIEDMENDIVTKIHAKAEKIGKNGKEETTTDEMTEIWGF
jgi:hypothetical protein